MPDKARTHDNNLHSDIPSHTQTNDKATPARGEDTQNITDNDLYIAGIGASAGGLEALEHFFNNAPVDGRVAFVVIQHLSPDFKSLMDEILARQTAMPIHRVDDGMKILAGNIYLIPAKKAMTVRNGHLYLTDRDTTRSLEMPIDVFFHSLAEDAGKRAIGIILSGTGTDGSRGIVSIRRAGGLVLAQAPETAKFDGMPRSALESGAVNLVLSPEEMPEALLKHIADPSSLGEKIVLTSKGEISDDEGVTALALLKKHYGIDFAYYKPTTVGRRLERRMALNQIQSLSAYLTYIQENAEELNALYKDLLIGVTSFFRDKESFERLEHQVIPSLFERAADQPAPKDIRCWVAGCATGEEVYSLAILLTEEAERRNFSGKITIFATDVHRESLDIASAGIYEANRLEVVSHNRMKRFFKQESEDSLRVSSELRGMVVFAPHNVISDPPFTKMDLVTCRNMLIYLMPIAQEKAISMFHFALRVGGVLFLGSSETPGALAPEFDTIDAKAKLYRKNRDVKLNIDMRVNPADKPRRLVAPMRAMATLDRSLLRDYDLLLERHLPPGIIVNENREIIHIFGDASRYLVRLSGRMDRDILDMTEGDLKLALGAALHRAAQEERKIVFSNVKVRLGSITESLDLTVESLHGDKPGQQHFHISFAASQSSHPAAGKEAAPVAEGSLYTNSEAAWRRVSELEGDLQTTRENLQATIEELQTTNEELQSTNEELLAANEELQSTNEELHSVNEELFTVNAEFEKKNRELKELNDDLDNLLRSTEVGTLFLDAALCIRKFNPAIMRSFRLLPHDIGRPVDHIAYQHPGRERMLRSLEEVLQSGNLAEEEIRDTEGNWLLRRVLPFKDSAGNTSGVVLTFLDITSVKIAEEERRQLDFIKALAASVPGLVFQFQQPPDGEGGYTFISDYTRDMLGQQTTRMLSAANSMAALVHEEDLPVFREASAAALQNGTTMEFEHRCQTDNGCVWLHTRGTPVRLSDGTTLWNGVSIDITPRKLAEANLAKAAEFYLSILNKAPALIWRAGQDALCNWFNATWLDFTGRSMEQEMGNGWAEGVHPDDMEHCLTTYTEAFSRHAPFEMEYRLRRHDGEFRWIVDFGCPIQGLDGSFMGYIGYCYDISERKQALADLELARLNAERASKSKSEFLANMSHEVRTPLNGIHGMLQLVLDGAADAEQREYAEIALQSCKRLTHLLTDILDLSRVEAGKLTIKQQPFTLDETMNHVGDLFRPSVIKSGVALETHVSPAIPSMLVGDPIRLLQVLNNLVGNAFKFTTAGRILVEAHPLPSECAGTIRVFFAVTDTGIGVPREKIDTLFQPFTQVTNGYNRQYQGAGLGLSICKHLVSLMGGDIYMESEPGEGTTVLFCCTFALNDLSGTPENTCALPLSQSRSLRVLLAEDDAVSRLSARRQLERAGFTVTLAVNGLEVLRKVQSEAFDIVLMDIQMPYMDGLETTRAIRAGEAGERAADVPIIAMTAYAMAGDKDTFIDAGMNSYIAKPFETDQLVELMHRLVE